MRPPPPLRACLFSPLIVCDLMVSSASASDDVLAKQSTIGRDRGVVLAFFASHPPLDVCRRGTVVGLTRGGYICVWRRVEDRGVATASA